MAATRASLMSRSSCSAKTLRRIPGRHRDPGSTSPVITKILAVAEEAACRSDPAWSRCSWSGRPDVGEPLFERVEMRSWLHGCLAPKAAASRTCCSLQERWLGELRLQRASCRLRWPRTPLKFNSEGAPEALAVRLRLRPDLSGHRRRSSSCPKKLPAAPAGQTSTHNYFAPWPSVRDGWQLAIGSGTPPAPHP